MGAFAQGIQHPVGHHWGPCGALWKGVVVQEREGTTDKTGVGRTREDGAVMVRRKSPGTPRRRTRHPRQPYARTPPVTIKEHSMRTRDPRSSGAQGVGGGYNAWRSVAHGPHTHQNAARQIVDDRSAAEVRGQQEPSNDPRNNQHNPR